MAKELKVWSSLTWRAGGRRNALISEQYKGQGTVLPRPGKETLPVDEGAVDTGITYATGHSL